MEPREGSRWMRALPHDPNLGPYNGYTVVGITNVMHGHLDHPPQVVYQGDNGHLWSLPWSEWPGHLVPEVK